MAGQSRKETGNRGEQLAMKYLLRLGFEIVELNYRFGHGEIDIVARDGETLVFCEVKTRYNDEFGPPEFALTPRKQQQIRKVAHGYLYEHSIENQECRFDVVTVRMQVTPPDVRYIRDAFS